MNTEIANVSKLVPATVVKNNRQNEGPASLEAPTDKKLEANPALSTDNLKEKDKKLGSSTTSVDTLKSAAAAGNTMLQAVNVNLEFMVDDSTKKVVIKIVDKQSGDIVRQIPSEDMLAFIKKMQELDGEKGSVLQDRA